MKNKKIVKKLFAGVMAVSLCLGTTSMLALAAPGEGDEKSATVSLTKQLNIAEGIETPDVTFSFNFDQQEQEDGFENATNTQADIPAKTLRFTKNDVQEGGMIVKETQNLLKDEEGNPIVFPNAGIYVYKVSEQAGAETVANSTGDGKMAYDGKVYIMQVSVKNDGNGGTVVDNVVVKPEGDNSGEKTNGTPTNPDDGEKPSDNGDDENVNGTGNAFRFENTYTKKTGGEDPDKPVIGDKDDKNSALKISKTVVGESADLNQKFNFTLNLTFPKGTEVTEVEAYVVNKDGNYAGEAIKAQVTTDEKTAVMKADMSFELADSEYLTFLTLPAGTTYSLTETGTTNFTGSISVKADEATAAAPTVEKAANVTFNDGLVTEKIDANSADVTNTYDDQAVAPTGILVNNLPYIAIILVAIVGCAVIAAGRKRRAN